MKIGTDENGIVLTEVYSGVSLKTKDGEFMGICMRDTGFEFNYEGVRYSAQQGVVREMKIDDKPIDTKTNNAIPVIPNIQ